MSKISNFRGLNSDDILRKVLKVNKEGVPLQGCKTSFMNRDVSTKVTYEKEIEVVKESKLEGKANDTNSSSQDTLAEFFREMKEMRAEGLQRQYYGLLILFIAMITILDFIPFLIPFTIGLIVVGIRWLISLTGCIILIPSALTSAMMLFHAHIAYLIGEGYENLRGYYAAMLLMYSILYFVFFIMTIFISRRLSKFFKAGDINSGNVHHIRLVNKAIFSIVFLIAALALGSVKVEYENPFIIYLIIFFVTFIIMINSWVYDKIFYSSLAEITDTDEIAWLIPGTLKTLLAYAYFSVAYIAPDLIRPESILYLLFVIYAIQSLFSFRLPKIKLSIFKKKEKVKYEVEYKVETVTVGNFRPISKPAINFVDDLLFLVDYDSTKVSELSNVIDVDILRIVGSINSTLIYPVRSEVNKLRVLAEMVDDDVLAIKKNDLIIRINDEIDEVINTLKKELKYSKTLRQCTYEYTTLEPTRVEVNRKRLDD